MADSWRPVAGWSDSRVAERIRADRIDILMVLAGRFDDNRPLVAAYGPAPVQMSLYDAATSGLAAMNYFIADSAMSPRSTSEEFAERVLRLPNFYVHAPIVDSPEVGRSPIESRGHVTFGCFNNPLKINERVLKTWARILVRLPNARLTLKYINMYQSTALRDRVDGTLSREGVDPGRVWMIEESQSARDHLQQHADIDIALDPFPFTGSTSTFEALWMGVPVVSLSGENFMARWTPSMLKKVGLQELVARTPDDYVDLAVHLATDIPRLTGLRARLRPALANSVLCDARRTMRYLERSQRAVWRRWCAAQRAG